ncbi:hypothetical protein D3C87_1950850 [compost metagenome]
MVGKGIPATRITGKGYGKTKPLVMCEGGNECSEAEHALNRRTEFKVTRVRTDMAAATK